MKKIKIIVSSAVILVALPAIYGATLFSTASQIETASEIDSNQSINLFVTHGHCSTPFIGKVKNVKLSLHDRPDLGNPMEDFKLSFDIDPNTFNVCAGKELTDRIKTPGLFISSENKLMRFVSSEVYTMGLDWYQINGTLSIKGVLNKVKLFATGIRKPNSTNTEALVIQGQLDLFDWDIDYDKLVTGKSDEVPTKHLYMNMQVKLM